MQKKIIALAVAGMFAAPVFAQSNVTIYGAMRVSVDNFNFQAANSDRSAVSDRASRIGFKGAEDLGNGLKAVWQWESNLNSTNVGAQTAATPGTGQRNTFLGLSGGFGTVLFGNHDTPYKLGGSADLFADTAADATCGTNGAGTGTVGVTCIIGANGTDLRLSNVIAYISPTFSGFHVAVAGVAGEESGAENAGNNANGLTDALSMLAVYENGPLKVTLAHEKVKAALTDSNAVVAVAGVADVGVVQGTNAVAPVAANASSNGSATKLNVGYKIGAIGLGYTYERSTNNPLAASATRVKDKAQLASVSYAMGATTLGLQMGKFDDRGNAVAGDSNADLSTWTAGAYHALSKRTQAYVGYHNAKLQGNNNDVKVLTMGLNHSF